MEQRNYHTTHLLIEENQHLLSSKHTAHRAIQYIKSFIIIKYFEWANRIKFNAFE